ncbi:MAG: GCN5-related N-acetyltransferase [Anaerosolibacter sp.]|jgi:putative acetyltransferase|nr:GCN5-related N-acetyltransferase [Anaerosolibacter sp.]
MVNSFGGMIMEFYIRPICIGDGKGVNELRRMPGVFENILGIPSERIKRNEDFIVSLDNDAHQFVAVAKEDSGEEKIIGTAGLNIFPNSRLRHSASIGIMVHKDFQNMGVGTRLMEAIIDIADNWLMLVRVELAVFADNEKAINLYKKFNFEIEGLKKKAAIRNGEYVDEIMMGRLNTSR